MQAHMLRGLLEREGIRATVMGEMLGPARGAIPMDAGTAPTVWVHAEDVERAKPVVARFDRRAEVDRVLATGGPWVCPSCGETIDAQFTDCWNCLKPRSADGASVEPEAAGPVDLTIATDLVCVRCGYNLRGLTPRHRCPECGLPILRSLLDVLRDDLTPDADELQRVLRGIFDSVATGVGYPASALIMICHAWMSAAYTTDLSANLADSSAERPTAVQVCLAVRDIAIDYFGGTEEAKLGLAAWRICRSGDIGWVLMTLIDVGVVDGAIGKLAEEYDGLFTLESLFAEVT
jgi:predicted RNA-binding Zn-ribbon protein involved in translation (DUF1610 family)